VYTDGTHWLHKYNPDDYEVYPDFRLGVIFTLSHIKHHLETSAENAVLNCYLKIRDLQIDLMSDSDFENIILKDVSERLDKKIEVKVKKIMSRKNKVIYMVKK
jgi:hypothetical protein